MKSRCCAISEAVDERSYISNISFLLMCDKYKCLTNYMTFYRTL